MNLENENDAAGPLDSKSKDPSKLSFVQIKRQNFDSKLKKYNLIKIIDISNEILYERASGERNLNALINVTVSHEMRNPINSIKS